MVPDPGEDSLITTHSNNVIIFLVGLGIEIRVV